MLITNTHVYCVTIEKSRPGRRAVTIEKSRPGRAKMSSSVDMNSGVVYLDCNATTPLAPEVLEAVTGALRDAWGNPSSGHHAGILDRMHVKIVHHFFICRS